MKFKTIDEVESLFTGELTKILGEDRGIELQYLDGSNWDISTNIAMKYRETQEVAEKISREISREKLGIEALSISEKGHINIKLSSRWHGYLMDLYEDRGLDICEKLGGTIAINPVSQSSIRIKSYKRAMQKIGKLRGVEIEFWDDGERIELGDMKLEGDYPEEIEDIAGISRCNKTEISGMVISKSNDMKNPSFKWNYINYRLQNIAGILEKEGIEEHRAPNLSDSEIYRLMLLKLKLKKALDEALKFRDPFKYYSWMEEYLDSFYSLKITRENCTVAIAKSLSTSQPL